MYITLTLVMVIMNIMFVLVMDIMDVMFRLVMDFTDTMDIKDQPQRRPHRHNSGRSRNAACCCCSGVWGGCCCCGSCCCHSCSRSSRNSGSAAMMAPARLWLPNSGSAAMMAAARLLLPALLLAGALLPALLLALLPGMAWREGAGAGRCAAAGAAAGAAGPENGGAAVSGTLGSPDGGAVPEFDRAEAHTVVRDPPVSKGHPIPSERSALLEQDDASVNRYDLALPVHLHEQRNRHQDAVPSRQRHAPKPVTAPHPLKRRGWTWNPMRDLGLKPGIGDYGYKRCHV